MVNFQHRAERAVVSFTGALSGEVGVVDLRACRFAFSIPLRGAVSHRARAARP